MLSVTDPVRLETREETPKQKPYRSWGSKIGRKNRELNSPNSSRVENRS